MPKGRYSRKPAAELIHITPGAAPEGPVPEPPERAALSGVALEKWRELAPALHKSGRLTELTRDAFVVYCQSWQSYVEAQERITAEGITIKTAMTTKPHPGFSIVARSVAAMRAIGRDFGLAPRQGPAKPADEEHGIFRQIAQRRSRSGRGAG